ncbi:MAG: acyl carrier protein [Planctomycetaceae bacterium]|nr:acyl carrier protein [Planctomycetaceae bacterium]
MSTATVTTEEILESITEVLCEALGVDDDEVFAAATLVGDLGAESIDFLDIVFRLEKTFDLKIPRGELFPESLTANNPEFVADGVVTEAGLAMLREKLPHADIDGFSNDPQVDHIQDLFTVQMLVNYIQIKIA